MTTDDTENLTDGVTGSQEKVEQLRDRMECVGTSCQRPGCDETAVETFTDGYGNDLALCQDDYFEAVYPQTRLASITRRDNDDGRPGFLEALR